MKKKIKKLKVGELMCCYEDNEIYNDGPYIITNTCKYRDFSYPAIKCKYGGTCCDQVDVAEEDVIHNSKWFKKGR